MSEMSYFWRVTLAGDMFLNALTGGWPGETVSSRCGRLYRRSRLARGMYELLDWLQYRHCERAMAAVADEEYIPPSLRFKEAA